MSRQNFLNDEPWDEVHEDKQIPHSDVRASAGGHDVIPERIERLLAGILAASAGRFPDVVAYPEQGIAWVATRDPEFPAPEVGDKGIIARFELPAEE
jgi:hypothetical protein